MATGAAAAAAIPAPGPVVNILVPEIPDINALTGVLGSAGGIAAAMVDLYGHIRQLGQSAQAVLINHVSSNNVTHDMLDAQIEALRAQLSGHGDNLNQASTLIGDLRTNATSLEAKMAEAAWKFSNLEGQFKILAMKNRDGLSLARDERCKSLGLLGSAGTNAPVYKKWCSTVAQICSEHYQGAKALLDKAKRYGATTVDPAQMNGIMEATMLTQFNHQLFGLLSQQTAGSIWSAVDNVQEHVVNGLEAWRVITYGCSPKSPIKAEEIRRAITNGEQGRASNMQELKNKLGHFESQIRGGS